jgi:hypothetical protein
MHTLSGISSDAKLDNSNRNSVLTAALSFLLTSNNLAMKKMNQMGKNICQDFSY